MSAIAGLRSGVDQAASLEVGYGPASPADARTTEHEVRLGATGRRETQVLRSNLRRSAPLGPFGDCGAPALRHSLLGLEPVAVPAEVQEAELFARLADQITLMAMFP